MLNACLQHCVQRLWVERALQFMSVTIAFTCQGGDTHLKACCAVILQAGRKVVHTRSCDQHIPVVKALASVRLNSNGWLRNSKGYLCCSNALRPKPVVMIVARVCLELTIWLDMQ